MINVTYIDRFKVIRVIGQGGQGEVIHVRDTDQKDYALKWLLPYIINQGSIDRFLREFQSICHLKHPNIIKVFEQGQFLNRPYFTMELVSGENLEVFIDKEKNFEVYYDLLIQICSALAYIHKHRLVHRDIKPSNVLIDHRGQARLMDFGLVKKLDASVQLTQADKFFGTMSYASPEQLLGEKIDYRSDLYSLGILIYRMFASKLPFQAESMAGIITKHLSAIPKPLVEVVPGCPGVLSDLCRKLLMKSPLDRTMSADDVAATIRSLDSKQKVSIRRSAAIRDASFHRLQLRFHGRDSELQSLSDSLKMEDFFSVRLICGQQGIGKTRLLNEAVRESMIVGNRRKIIRCSGQSSHLDNNRKSFFHFVANEIESHRNELGDLEGILPEIAPLHQAFQPFDTRARVPYVQPGGGSFQYKVRYLSALVAHLTRIVPWHIIWEDIHLANAFEIDCITDLIDLSLHEPINCCIWATVRTDDFRTSSDFDTFISDFQSSQNSEVIILKPLAPAVAGQIIASLINIPEHRTIVNQIVEYCQGNPSIMLGTVQQWIDNGNLIERDGRLEFAHDIDSRETVGPIELQDIAQQRLHMLSEESLELLTWIAALEQDAYLEIIRYGMQFPEKILMNHLNDMLFHNFIINQSDASGERYHISSPILRDTLVVRAGSDKIRQIHAETVGILELLGGRYADPAMIGRYQEKSGDSANACKNYFKAAQAAYAENQMITSYNAIVHSHRLLGAIATNSRAGQMLKARILIFYSKLLFNVGTMDENHRLIAELQEILPSIHDLSMKNDLYHFVITTFTYSYRFDESRQWLQQYEKVLQAEATEKNAFYYQLHAMLCYFQQDFEDANRFWKKSLLLQKSTGAHPETIATTMFMLAKTLTVTGRYKASLQLLRHAFKLAPKGHSLRTQALLLAEMGNVAFYQRQSKTAVSYLERSRAINDKLGLKYAFACNLHDIALCHHLQGNLMEAIRLCRESLGIFRVLKTPRENAMGVQTAIAFDFEAGDYAEATFELNELDRMFGEDLYYERYTLVVWLHHRTLCMTAGRAERRSVMARSVKILRKFRTPEWNNSIRLMILHERLADNDLDAAERISRRITGSPSNILNYLPYQLQVFIIRITRSPLENHWEVLDGAFFDAMQNSPSLESERICLQKIREVKDPKVELSSIEQAIEAIPVVPTRSWLLMILAYRLDQIGETVEAERIRRREESVRRVLAENLSPEAQNEFLSRKIIIRI